MLREEGGLGLQRFTIRMRCAWLVGSGALLGAAREIKFVPLLDEQTDKKGQVSFSIDTHGQTDVPPPTHHHPSACPPSHSHSHNPIKKPKGKFLYV